MMHHNSEKKRIFSLKTFRLELSGTTTRLINEITLPKTNIYDYTIIGGGIIGMSVAWQLKQLQPERSVLVIEKEPRLAQHQTSHNSGVIHAGVYYQPGSLKADFCKRGLAATLEFCRQHGIPVKQPGKLLVATNDSEYRRMILLSERADKNGINTELLQKAQLKNAEPNISGVGALLVSQTGIVDYQLITECMAKLFQSLGGELKLNTELTNGHETDNGISLKTNQGLINTKYLISCAGLMADRITQSLNIKTDFSIIPFRGEYYKLKESKCNIVQRMIYPIPDPDLPFLGVHLTPMIDGSIIVGPNAVVGWKREGYGNINFNLRDSLEMLSSPGFWKLSKKHFASGVNEYKNSFIKSAYLKLIQKYCPSLQLDDLTPYPAGIRAQAVLKDGTLVHDFLFAESARSLHVCNAPSPAATSAIPIGEYMVKKIQEKSIALI
jgi:L-2-hydroxyglutarate oxidase